MQIFLNTFQFHHKNTKNQLSNNLNKEKYHKYYLNLLKYQEYTCILVHIKSIPLSW